jgi:phosphatidylglycerophosphatase A
MSNRFALWVATGFGVGRLPLAPGTWGTVVGVGYAGALALLSWPWQFLVFVAGLGVAVWSAGVAEKALKRRDPPQVVIDEIVAFPLTLAVAAWTQQLTPLVIGAAFVFFRVTDILKPPPVRQSQRLPGGWGVVTDDVFAAVYAAIAVSVLQWTALRLGWNL